MATNTTSTLLNEYQKYFSKQLLEHAIQLTVLDQFGLKQGLPRKKGATTISFFRRSRSKINPATGLVDNVQTLTEGNPIATTANMTLDRVDVPLVQLGEAGKVSDILTMTEFFDSLKQNMGLFSEDCALNADAITRNALVTASMTGVTLQQASGSTTETITKMYAQGAASMSALQTAGTSGGKFTAVDGLRAATQLKLNRAPMWGGYYVGIVPPQVSHDLQNDPDWIDSANWGDPSRRFRGELKTYAGCRFVENTNAFIEDGTGTEGVYAGNATQANQVYRLWFLGQGVYGVPAIEGNSPYKPSITIVDGASKSDILNQYIAFGWKAFWAAAGLNCPFGISMSAKTEFK